MTRLLVISPRDNVGVALEPLSSGEVVDVRDGPIHVAEAVPRGHKVALREIQAGEPVIKYGSSIGTASARIGAGMHVHTHNLASARGRGDLSHPRVTDARIAEPPE